MMIYDKHGNKMKAYDKDGREICVISTWQAEEQWREQYEQTILAEKVAIIEALAIVGLIAAQIMNKIRRI